MNRQNKPAGMRRVAAAIVAIFLSSPVTLLAGPSAPGRETHVERVPKALRYAMGEFGVEAVVAGKKTLRLSIHRGFMVGAHVQLYVRKEGKLIPNGGGVQYPPLLDDNDMWTGCANLTAEERRHAEFQVDIFETDTLAQHEWSPEDSKAYRVLWRHTYRPVSR